MVYFEMSLAVPDDVTHETRRRSNFPVVFEFCLPQTPLTSRQRFDHERNLKYPFERIDVFGRFGIWSGIVG